MTEYIYLSPPSMTGREMAFIEEAFQQNRISPTGESIEKFEDEISALAGVRSAAALSSGTAAVFLSLKALGVKAGDAVFCSDLTFAGSAFPILYLGAEPVFIDCEPTGCNMSPQALEKGLELARKQNRLPKAVIIVDLYGNPADYDALLPICARYQIPVLEDAAEALGAVYRGQNCGSFGEAAVFSFNGNKIITTSSGGMVVSHNEKLTGQIKFWASQSREPVLHYEHKEIGYNFRMSNICAAIGRGQMTGLTEKIRRRKFIKDYYGSALSGYPVRFVTELPECRSNNWLCVMLTDDPNNDAARRIIAALAENGIESRPVWKPMHEQPVFKDAAFVPHLDGEYSIASDLYRRGICLPSGDGLRADQLDRITEIIKSCF